ncbi:hypothetical protein NQ318_006004 [Aromia moschata]|uniref:Ionotropic glutamate receptor L-glutamate and glycine-binding domain-containing protein n=1 Tax=Aromia moschata TaxID=1265417 RepID=A0AAV8XZM1_9CUCU|nr:hypothetical protein NQ318_006004 [Aromia moschata]
MTGQIAFDDKGQRNSLGLHIFELREDGIVTIGVWNESYRLNVASTIEFDDEENTLVVITTLTEPFAMLKQSSKELTGNDRLEGFAIDLIEELSLMCGFDYRLRIQTDNRIGNTDSVRLTWDGMIGDILDYVSTI